jgi:hypothetical protein
VISLPELAAVDDGISARAGENRRGSSGRQDAGVDKSTAYARRRVHAEFAQAWAILDEATGYLIPPGWVRATPPEDEGEGDQPRAGG